MYPTKTLTLLLTVLIQVCPSPRAYAASQPQRAHSLLLQSTNSTPTTLPPPPTTTPPVVELPEFIAPIGNQSVAVGGDVQLACKISKLGLFRTAWLRVEDKGILTIHNNVITRNYRIGLTSSSSYDEETKTFTLTIKNVQPSDKGGYMCQINSVPMRYAVGYLDVLTAPTFDNGNETNTSGAVVLSEGSNATLSCRATGNPAPAIIWRRENFRSIRLSREMNDEPMVEGDTLRMAQVSRANSGEYLCIASNGIQPSASKRFILDVQYRPVIRLPQTEVGACLGQTEARLSCYVDMNPAGTYHWVRLQNSSSDYEESTGGVNSIGEDDDQALIEKYELLVGDKHAIDIRPVDSEIVEMILVVRLIEKSDFARYKCIARNKLGNQSGVIRLYETKPFSFNSMFDSTFGGETSSTPRDLDQQQQQQQQLEDQQQTAANRTTTSRGRTQYLSSWTNSRSSWLTLHHPSKASSAACSALCPPASLLIPLSALVASLVVVIVVDARTSVREQPTSC